MMGGMAHNKEEKEKKNKKKTKPHEILPHGIQP